MLVKPLPDGSWLHLYDTASLIFEEDITEPNSHWLQLYRIDNEHPEIMINEGGDPKLDKFFELSNFLSHKDFHQYQPVTESTRKKEATNDQSHKSSLR